MIFNKVIICEVLSCLKKTDLEIALDSNKRQFAFIKNAFLTKNVKMSLSQKEFENVSVARMYDNPEDEYRCSIVALNLSKNPPTDQNFFLLPRETPS